MEAYTIQFERYSDFSYNIIKLLINKCEKLWKLIKYNTADALEKPNLTEEEKIALIYKGGADNIKPFIVHANTIIPIFSQKHVYNIIDKIVHYIVFLRINVIIKTMWICRLFH